MKKYIFYIIIIAFIGGGSGCQRASCPANTNGYVDAPKKAKQRNGKKPKSGLFPKDMQRR
ncbi:MAG: hypothetical protein M3Q97_07475 [Bacteroidota bacterium]|nr:hypothetical protein [Bacteroidota bacterium]